MTTTSQPALVGRRQGAPFFYAGWAGFALFGIAVYLDGHADLGYAVFHVAIAAAVCTWFAMTTGRAAPVVGAVLGALFLLQMAFFLVSDLSESDTALRTTLEDGFGLVSAVLILVGAVSALRSWKG